MLLTDRVAVVYGGGGFVGGAVARAFAAAGATVFLAGRTAARLGKVRDEITSSGGTARVAEVDAHDDAAVDEHAAAVVADAGRIDVWCNAMAYETVQGAPLAELPLDHVMRPVADAVRGEFHTVRAAARHMEPRRSGVILTVTGYGPPAPGLGGTSVSWATVESLYRQWACELGPAGIRVVWLRTGGFRESILGSADYRSAYMMEDGAPVLLSDRSGGMARKRSCGGCRTPRCSSGCRLLPKPGRRRPFSPPTMPRRSPPPGSTSRRARSRTDFGRHARPLQCAAWQRRSGNRSIQGRRGDDWMRWSAGGGLRAGC